MKNKINFGGYDTLLQPTEWRYAAALVGLVQYLDYFNFEYQLLYDCESIVENSVPGFDGVMYKQEYINEEKYLEFAENYFADDMTHCQILSLLESDEFDDEKIRIVNDLIKGKTILKNLAGTKEFDGTNAEYFRTIILENRYEIIKEIFRNGKNLYANYSNKRLLFTDENQHCRLVGYNVDKVRKTKFLGFCFSKDSFVSNDVKEFDFIPFAFSKTSESYFINNNYSVQTLLKTKQKLEDELEKSEVNNTKTNFFTLLKTSYEFVDCDVEIIVKSRELKFYKTLFVRYKYLERLKKSISKGLLDAISNVKLKITDKYSMNLEFEVYNRCLNGLLLDDLIEIVLKYNFNKSNNFESEKQQKNYIINKSLIKINESWKEVPDMDGIKSAKKMGHKVSIEFIKQNRSNKINSYKQKLIGAIVAHDYDRVNEILLSLSAYVGMEFNFAYPLFENPEQNKSLAYSFANALTDSINYDNKNDEIEEEEN